MTLLQSLNAVIKRISCIIALCRVYHQVCVTFLTAVLLFCSGDEPLPTAADLQLEHYSSHQDVKAEKKSIVGSKLRMLLEKKAWAQSALLSVTIFMTSLVLGDAVLTPAQSGGA